MKWGEMKEESSGRTMHRSLQETHENEDVEPPSAVLPSWIRPGPICRGGAPLAARTTLSIRARCQHKKPSIRSLVRSGHSQRAIREAELAAVLTSLAAGVLCAGTGATQSTIEFGFF